LAETPKKLDRFDEKLLLELVSDGRQSWKELAQRVGLSETPTVRRVRAMEASGVISGYAALVDDAQVGRPISVFISISLEGQNKSEIERCEAEITSSPLIRSCYMMAGDVDYLLRVAVKDIAELRTFLDDVLRPIPGMKRISSAFALKTVVERKGPRIS
jgi:DNA-binding Lrp family transcriptional regulator